MVQQNKFSGTPAQREQLFMILYKKTFPVVAKYVSKMGGSFDDAKDIFQDALVIYYEKMTSGSLILQSNEQVYLLGIVKHLWAKKFRNDLHYSSLENSLEEADFAEDDISQPSSARLMYYLETTGQKCMEILKAFYYDNLPVNTIAILFGYSGTHSATVKKYKCMEKVRETIKQRSIAYEDFIE